MSGCWPLAPPLTRYNGPTRGRIMDPTVWNYYSGVDGAGCTGTARRPYGYYMNAPPPLVICQCCSPPGYSDSDWFLHAVGMQQLCRGPSLCRPSHPTPH